MIDWHSLALSALWVFGLALVLSTVSFAAYDAGEAGVPLRRYLARPQSVIVIDLGLALACVGFTGGALAHWRSVVWALLALVYLADAVLTWRRRLPRSQRT